MFLMFCKTSAQEISGNNYWKSNPLSQGQRDHFSGNFPENEMPNGMNGYEISIDFQSVF
jgi:hypothetical protein